MSFSIDAVNELLESRSTKTCCTKAFVTGLCIAALALPEETNKIRLQLRTKELAELASELLTKQFSASPEICRTVKAGREVYLLDF